MVIWISGSCENSPRFFFIFCLQIKFILLILSYTLKLNQAMKTYDSVPSWGILFDRSRTSLELSLSGFADSSIFVQCMTPDKNVYFITLENLKLRLWELTRNFVMKYTFSYFKQFTGDLRDLCQEFYVEFLTPNSRKGRKETLLDKYDYRITSFEYLVKCSVIRKLIDRSRVFKKMSSIESLQTEFGDGVLESFKLFDTQPHTGASANSDLNVDSREFSEDEISYFVERYMKLSSSVRKVASREFLRMRGVCSSGYRSLFDALLSADRSFSDRTSSIPKVGDPSEELSKELDLLFKLF